MVTVQYLIIVTVKYLHCKTDSVQLKYFTSVTVKYYTQSPLSAASRGEKRAAAFIQGRTDQMIIVCMVFH